MPARRLILPLLWLGALLLGPTIRPASAQTRPLARPDSLVREPADSLVVEPVAVPDTLVPAAGAPPGVYEPLASARRRAPEQGPASFAYVDSLTSRLLLLGRWAAVDSLGRLALAAGTDYPVLRQRLGYAAAMRGRPAEAVRQYQYALHDNAADPVSRLGLSYAWLALNQRELASRAAHPLSDSVRRALHLTPRALARLEAEGSVQFPTSRGRGTAGFGRLEALSQLGGGLLLTQTLAYYGQQVRYGFPPDGPPPPGPLPPGPPRPSLVPVRQHDYQALLTAPLGGHLVGKLAYHFVRSRFASSYYQGHLGYAALRYVRPTWQLQAGLYAGRLTDTTRTQTDVQLSVFPLGNLNLHAFGRAALVRTAGRSYPHLVLGAGGRLAPRLWLDGYAGWGRVPVLADQDGTYVYNLLDPLRRRLGLGLLVPLPGGHWLGRLYYGAEARTQIQTLTPYTQHTLTLAATWTW